MWDGEAQSHRGLGRTGQGESTALESRGLHGGACWEMWGAMYMDWMTAWVAPRIHLESLANWGQEKKVAVKEMIEICQNLDLWCSNLTVETGLIHSGASARAADCAALLSWQQGLLAPATQNLPLRLWNPGKTLGALQKGWRETVALFPNETCLSPAHWEGLLAFSDSLVNNLKSFPQVPRSVKTITWDYSLKVWKISKFHKQKQGKKTGHFPKIHFLFHVHENISSNPDSGHGLRWKNSIENSWPIT